MLDTSGACPLVSARIVRTRQIRRSADGSLRRRQSTALATVYKARLGGGGTDTTTNREALK
jgi:hypothetical protein